METDVLEDTQKVVERLLLGQGGWWIQGLFAAIVGKNFLDYRNSRRNARSDPELISHGLKIDQQISDE